MLLLLMLRMMMMMNTTVKTDVEMSYRINEKSSRQRVEHGEGNVRTQRKGEEDDDEDHRITAATSIHDNDKTEVLRRRGKPFFVLHV